MIDWNTLMTRKRNPIKPHVKEGNPTSATVKSRGQVLCCCNISVLPKFQPTRRDTCRFVNSPYIFYNLTFTPQYQYASSLCCSLNISNVTRTFLTIKKFFSSHLFNLFSKPWCLIQRWYSFEKLNSHHSLGLQG